MPVKSEDIRTDYLDYCFSKINSTEPYAIRAWALEQAFQMSKFFPELIEELKSEMAMMEFVDIARITFCEEIHRKENLKTYILNFIGLGQSQFMALQKCNAILFLSLIVISN